MHTYSRRIEQEYAAIYRYIRLNMFFVFSLVRYVVEFRDFIALHISVGFCIKSGTLKTHVCGFRTLLHTDTYFEATKININTHFFPSIELPLSINSNNDRRRCMCWSIHIIASCALCKLKSNINPGQRTCSHACRARFWSNLFRSAIAR